MENEARKPRGKKLQKKSDVFISWSGINSREIAEKLQTSLETKIFADEKIKCFVSNRDIASGVDWQRKIYSEIRSCKIGIICITKENVKAPWIYYEAGAMMAYGVKEIIPLRINCSLEALKDTPLQSKQAIDFHDFQSFCKMICDIAEEMGYRERTEDEKKILIKAQYEQIKQELKSTLKKLRDYRLFNATYVYPNKIDAVRKNTIFVSTPMSSIPKEEYKTIRENLMQIREILYKIGFTEVFCPAIQNENPSHFDGKTKAIRENFPQMKQADSMLVIYPCNVPSSSLVENGYAIALTKRIVIFHKERLPYILEDAGGAIHNVKTFAYEEFDDIRRTLDDNGMALFDGGYDDL